MSTLLNLPQEGIAPLVYHEAIAFMRTLFEDIQAGQPVTGAKVFVVIDHLLEAFNDDGRTLLGLTAQLPDANPMASHAVNACILTLATARGLGYGTQHLHEAGAAALLHDLGLVQIVDHGDSRQVSYAALKQHEHHTLELLEQIPELSRLTLYLAPVTDPAHARATPAVPERHRPQQIQREQELRKVIRLADLYEALSHPRADGQPLAFAAVRTILSTHQLFDPRLMKAFFDQVGIYPLGTWAQLSTGEIGLVTGIQPGLPLRPTVTVFYDRDGLRYAEGREVALSEHPTLFIRRSLSSEPQPRK